MSLPNIEPLDGSPGEFWNCFYEIIPEAVRCRFFCTAMGIVNGRLRELNRESGPFLDAIRRSHLPCALRRLSILKDFAGGLSSFTADSDDFRLEMDPLASVFEFISRFEREVVVALDDGQKRNDEPYAKQVVETIKEVAKNMARSAKELFTLPAAKLEQQVANCVISRTQLQSRFVSCVSLDLAQYGRHSKILDNYVEAPGVFSLNRRIRNDISASLQANEVPCEDLVLIDTGDGALLLFLGGEGKTESTVIGNAYNFSKTFLDKAYQQTLKIDAENQLHFRVGISSGLVEMEHVCVRSSEVSQCHAGGLPLGTAVRLQSAARTGEIVVCARTRQYLPKEVQALFNRQENIFGKVHEKTPIIAHRYACIPPCAPEADSSIGASDGPTGERVR